LREIAAKGLHVNETEAPAGSDDELQWHPYDTHIYVLEGAYVHIESDGGSAVVSAGDFQFTPARVLHRSVITRDVKVVFGTSAPVDPSKPRHSPDELPSGSRDASR